MGKGGQTMPVYITLVNYTQEGVENIKESPARLDQVKRAIQAAGGEMYDEIYAATLLAIASAGAIRTETLRAFTEEEYREIIASLP
jgi:uncharacterized protein with GYD domain